MKSTVRFMACLLAAAFMLGLCACIEEEEDKPKRGPMTWEEIARNIDSQLGEISDGTAQTCDGQGLAVGWGTHCKNRLEGTVSDVMVVDYMRITNDTVLFGDNDTTIYNDGAFFQRGATFGENYCNVACLSGTASCYSLGEDVWRVDYQTCTWQGPVSQWLLNGSMEVNGYLTDQNEHVAIKHYFSGFSGTNLTNGNSYRVSGLVILYQVIDPFDGQLETGTTPGSTANDGMVIMDFSAAVTQNGIYSGPYRIYAAQDFEDGLVFFTGGNAAVWVNPVTPTVVGFFDRNHPWNNFGLGCMVSITPTGGRTFNFTNPTGCLPSAGAVY